MTATLTKPPTPEPPAPPVVPEKAKVPAAIWMLAGVVLAWVLVRLIWGGQAVQALGPIERTQIHLNLNTWPIWVQQNQNVNPVFLYFLNHLQIFLDAFGNLSIRVFARNDWGLGIPEIGWLGTTVLLTWLAWVVGNAKVAALTAGVLVVFVLQGLWDDAMLTFAQVAAAVLIALVIGIPLGIWAGVSARTNSVISPVLDFLQIMPALAYLAPLALIFGIGIPSSIAATVVFALAPVIRLTALGIRQVPATTREAVDSLGVTGFQRLRTTLLPIASRSMILGINQTIMAALAMVAVCYFLGAPGLGVEVGQALQSQDVGRGFNAGLAIVLMAIALDRVTTAAGNRRRDLAAAAARPAWVRPAVVWGGGLVAVLAIWGSRRIMWAAVPPENWPSLGTVIVDWTNAVVGWVQDNLAFLTRDIRDGLTYAILNPVQDLLTQTPFFVVIAAITIIAWVAGGVKPAVITVLALIGIVLLGVWADAMITLASTLFGAVIAMVFALVLGVWMGRSPGADKFIRPTLDAAQTMPAFVYLIPFLGLFGASRFTAIMAAVVYAAPPAIKIVADGIRQVSAHSVEAAESVGMTRWQMIGKVQLPMARKSVALAANQAVIYTLSMVVLGAAAGAGGLGYDVLNGLAKQLNYFGKGLAAGLALVLLGVVLDRITQSVADRARRSAV